MVRRNLFHICICSLRAILERYFKLTGLCVSLFAAHVDNEVYLGRALERLGDAALKEQEPDIGAAFLKFAVVTKELSALMKTLVRAQPYKQNLCQHMRITKYSVLSFLTVPCTEYFTSCRF